MNLMVLVLIIVIACLPYEPLRIALGLPFALFFPGYSLMLALFPGKDKIGNTERIALSFGLSIAVVPLIGLILNYTPSGITVESSLYSIAGFILIMSLAAYPRLKGLDETERFGIDFIIEGLETGGKWGIAITAILVISIVAASGTLNYVFNIPDAGDSYTEFYILGSEVTNGEYPTDLSIGEEAWTILGIVNHEQETVDYRIEIVINGDKYSEVNTLTLDDEETWEGTITFLMYETGSSQKVEFFLYKNNRVEFYLSTQLLVNVE